MLHCSRCEWIGVNLIPHEEDNTARCPDCGMIMSGFTAEKVLKARKRMRPATLPRMERSDISPHSQDD